MDWAQIAPDADYLYLFLLCHSMDYYQRPNPGVCQLIFFGIKGYQFPGYSLRPGRVGATLFRSIVRSLKQGSLLFLKVLKLQAQRITREGIT